MSTDFVGLLGMRLDDVAKTDVIQPLMTESTSGLIEDRLHLLFPTHGVEFVADLDGRVSTIVFYSSKAEGFREFSGSLPESISFGECEQVIQRRLGQPSSKGGGQTIQFFGKVPKWNRYDREGFALHIQYGDDERSIKVVSLMRPDSIPR